ncbi:helix-turn-helix transcriptional regulator [Sphingomonas colocasiae]|uniref:AlpA family phage regulatory protein n=1 Tax=Sphingomonas colocasiae TaxID=1848973 RepID=A0ABS7PLV4_9SPHN|nr:AlpA family phage regulatory protein [Sphingomonas colocasiae]MBY8821054.1 AlpA family phage regulatory protein [Sphingomonas colocasiae]
MKDDTVRNDAPLVSMKIAIHLTSLSRATIYRRIAERKFPPLVDLGGRRIAFHREELDRWIANPGSYQPPA